MKRRYFGTDGIRDRVGGPLLQPEFLRALGFAWGACLVERADSDPVRVVIGRDTRESGPEVRASLLAGLAYHRVEVLDADVIPTPAIVHAIRHFGASGGIAVTASHNPAADNGVKLFGRSGVKLNDAEEVKLEARIEQALAASRDPMRPAAFRQVDALESYRESAERVLPAGALAGWTLAFDGANGPAVRVNPAVLRRAGAQLASLGGDAPPGLINDRVGSEFPERVCRLTTKVGARIGIIHDGDGDRVRFCDETGSLLDGDEALGLLALDADEQGRLPDRTAVFTVMSNLGLDASLQKAGISVVRVGVGDRCVQHEMLRRGFKFGGESSGHIIPGDLTSTGDGLLASLRMLELLIRTGKPLSALRRRIRLYPQMQESIDVGRKVPIDELPALRDEIRTLEGSLDGQGRLLVRYSGTEPKLRLLVEAPRSELVVDTMGRLRVAVEQEFGTGGACR